MIYIIELRKYINHYIDFLTTKKYMESNVCHISSTLDLAINWIRNNSDFNGEDRSFWWAIYSDIIDAEHSSYDELYFYSSDGVKLKNQP